MVSDAWIVYPVHEAALRQTGPVYGYMFDHHGETDIVHILGSSKDYGNKHLMYYWAVILIFSLNRGLDKIHFSQLIEDCERLF